jgi:Icc protein
MLNFIHISDTHLNPDPTYTGTYADYSSLEGTRALVEQVNALPFTPDFVLHTGDVVYDPLPEAYEIAAEVLGGIKYPTYYLAGNHDHAPTLQRALMGRREVIAPLYYEFEVNGVQIICLDSNGPVEVPRGYVTAEQLASLEGLCSAQDERPLMVAVHHNPVPVGIAWLDEFMAVQNGEDLHRALLPARQRMRGVFFGHVHQNIEMYRDGILYSSVLSSWCQFHAWPGMPDTTPDLHADPGFNHVMITRDQTFIRRYRFRV